MKFKKWIIGLAVIGILSQSLEAQDVFSSTRLLQLSAPQLLVHNVLATTNEVDVIGYYGRGDIILNTSTNAGGALTFTLNGSTDNTNWSGISNFALINSGTSIIYTNLSGGNSNAVTDVFLNPYTAITPFAATAGFSTPYPSYLPFTNSAGAITVTTTGNYVIGVNLTDCPRYLQAVWTASGAATNGATFVSATLWGNHNPTP